MEITDSDLFLTIVENLLAGCSTAVNIFLIYLILFKSPVEMKEYRFFLFQITPQPTFPVLGAVIRGPLKYLGYPLGSFVSFFFMEYVFVFCIITINAAFLYRFVSLADDRLHDFYMRKSVLAVLVAIGQMICVLPPLVSLLNSLQRPEFLKRYYREFPTRNGSLDDAVFFAFGDNNFGMKFIVLPGIALSATINLFIAYRIVAKLHSFRHVMSTATYKMHLRLTTALVVQTLSPIVLCCGPVTVLAISTSTQSDTIRSPIFGAVLILMVATHPFVNALSTLFFVVPYRKLITDFVKYRLLQKRGHQRRIADSRTNTLINGNKSRLPEVAK